MKSKAFFAFAIALTLLFSTVASASVVSADDNLVLDNGNAKFVFIGEEYKSMSDAELQSIADAVYLRDLRTRAAANLTTKSCANNSTVSWGPYTSSDKCTISWKVTSDKATTIEATCSGVFSNSKMTISDPNESYYYISNAEKGTYNLSIKNTGAATVKIGGTFDMQYNRI